MYDTLVGRTHYYSVEFAFISTKIKKRVLVAAVIGQAANARIDYHNNC